MNTRQKQKRITSKKYLDWVKTLDSEMSGTPADDAHHACGLGFGGMGTKPHDFLAIPLTRGEHREIHDDPTIWPLQWEMLVRTLHRAFQDGVIDFTDGYK